MKKYRYIHFLLFDTVQFNKNIVEMYNDKDNDFDINEVLFVTPHERVYHEISKYNNVVYYDAKKRKFAKMINEYARSGDWLFVHSLPFWNETLKIKRKYWKKIIWRTWGSEFSYLRTKENQPIKNIIKCIIQFLIKYEVRRFKAVGVNNAIDELDICERFGNIFTLTMPYPNKTNIVNNGTENRTKCDTDMLNVMIGHSCFMSDNHISVMQRFERFKNEKMRLYIISSYGNAEYIRQVKEYAEKNWQNKVIFVDEFMPYSDYVAFIKSMDILVLDATKSYALGNVEIFLSEKKKIILNEEGVLHRAFVKERIPHLCTNDLQTISFACLQRPLDYPENVRYSLGAFSYEEDVEKWHDIHKALNF